MHSWFGRRGEALHHAVLWVSFIVVSGLPLGAQPRVSVFGQGYHRPVALLPLSDGGVLVAQENGWIVRADARGLPAAAPWFRLWEPLDTRQRVISARILSERPALRVLAYVSVWDETLSDQVGRLVLLQEDGSENGPRSVEVAAVLVDGLPAAPTRMGGGMVLDADGTLFLGTGNAEVPERSQDPDSLGGKVLRLDLREGTALPLTPTVWATGFHSVQGLAFLGNTDLLYAADMGPRPPLARNWDEINLVVKGRNYGFPLVFGGRASPPYQAPVVHSTGVRLWDPGELVSLGSGPWANSLVWTGVDSQALYRIVIDPREPNKVMFFEELLTRAHGRLRGLAVTAQGQVLVGTFNATEQNPGVDRILLVVPR